MSFVILTIYSLQELTCKSTFPTYEEVLKRLQEHGVRLRKVFRVKKFYSFLYGRKFTLVTDHKPLTIILGPRLQRWALVLSAYSYDIEFRPTEAHGNADSPSRLPLSEMSSEGASSAVINISQLKSLPVTSQQLQATTPILSKILRFAKKGWPDDEIFPYWSH